MTKRTKRHMMKRWMTEATAALLLLLFFYTALSKLLDFQAFQGQLLLQPFSPQEAMLLAWVLPAVELTACCLLLFPRTRLYGLFLSTALMAVFTAYVSLVLLRFFGSIPCSCGGVLNSMGWEAHLVFNVFFLALSITATVLQFKAGSLPRAGDGSLRQAGQKGGSEASR